jgi:hypothetical protein
MSSFLEEAYKQTTPRSVLDEAANVVLAYSMAAIFLIRNQGIELTRQHFFRMVDYIRRNKSGVDFQSVESATGTVDQISIRGNVSDAAQQYIINKLTDRFSSDFVLVKNIITFLNNDTSFNALAASVTNNGVINRIIIDIDNVSVDSPRDVSILIDNTAVEVFKSFLPIYDFRSGVGGMGQKELAKDYGYETQRKFLHSSFGVDIGEDSAVYYQTAHNNGSPSSETVEAATRGIYEEVCRKISLGLQGAYDTPLVYFKQDLLQAMMASCYGVDITCEGDCLILTDSDGHSRFNVAELFDKLNCVDMKAVCPENLNPSVRIVDGDGKDLFKLRFKKEKYAKNITGYRYKLYFTPSNMDGYLSQRD